MKITIAQLETFYEVMRTGSMSAAARNLNKTQPAVSLTLKGLEQTIGMTLFERANRKLIPVPEAQYLLSEAEEVLGRVARVQRNLENLGEGERGTLQFAAMPGLATALVPAFMAEYTRTKPQIQVRLLTRSSAQLKELVSSQRVDIGTGDFVPDEEKSARTYTTMISGRCYVAVHRSNQLATLKQITPQQLCDQRLCTLLPEHAFTKHVLKCFEREATHTPPVHHTSQTILPLLQFVANAQSTVVVDPLTLSSVRLLNLFSEDIVFKPFNASVRYEYAVLTPKFRPSSVIAKDVTEKWAEYIVTRLQELGADPIQHG